MIQREKYSNIGIIAIHRKEGNVTFDIALLPAFGFEVDVVVVADVLDAVVKNPDDVCCAVAGRELSAGSDVERVPTIMVVSVRFEVVEDGIGILDVAEGKGEANEPDMWSSLKNGEKP